MNISTPIKEIEFKIEAFPEKKHQAQIASLVNSFKRLRNNTSQPLLGTRRDYLSCHLTKPA